MPTKTHPLTLRITDLFSILFLVIFICACNPPPPMQHITLQKGALLLKIAPDTGARVASLQYHGKELLSMVKDKDAFRWGSTVWPSPQAAWDWPPPEVMDKGNYSILEQSPSSITLESPPKAYKDLQVTKHFQLVDENNIQIQYSFENKGDTMIQVGIWEVTRIPYTGRIFWKTGLPIELPTIGLNQVGSISFFQLEGHKEPGKLFVKSDGGWVAYEHQGVRLTKKFAPIAFERIAPEQAPIEIYYEPVYKFAEIEEHGPYVTLQASESTTFELTWSLETID